MKSKIKLSQDQEQAVDLIKKFIKDKDENIFLLQGHAGTGKTTILKIIIQHLIEQRKQFCLCAPTHRAKSVLENSTGCKATTLHKLLSMQPNINIFDLDFSFLKFKSKGITMFPTNGVVVCDEASMINDELYGLLCDYADITNSKLIFVGDKAQLQAVGDRSISKVFNVENHFSLTKIHRQNKDNDIFDVLNILRKEPIKNWIEYSNLKSLEMYIDNPGKFLDDLTNDVKIMLDKGDVNHTKLIAFRNVIVQGMNKFIRSRLFDDIDVINETEIITGYSNFKQNGYEFYNSSDYIILESKYKKRRLPYCNIEVPGFDLKVLDTGFNIKVDLYVLDHSELDITDLFEIAANIESIRLDAVTASNSNRKYKASQLWNKYYTLTESFATMCDLDYDGRIIKSKSLDYGYCSTIHKVQGVTLDNVYIDMGDVQRCLNREQLRQLQYVGLSRTSNNVKMYL